MRCIDVIVAYICRYFDERPENISPGKRQCRTLLPSLFHSDAVDCDRGIVHPATALLFKKDLHSIQRVCEGW